VRGVAPCVIDILASVDAFGRGLSVSGGTIMLSTKLALRLARRWQDAWEAARKPKPALDTAWDRLESRFDIARRVRARLEFASAGQFPLGVRNLTADLGYHLGELARMLGNLR